MSKTDKTRPAHVQERDSHAMRPEHFSACIGGGECDLPDEPRSHDSVESRCRWVPVRGIEPYWKAFSDTPYRQACRRAWFSSDRAAQRAIARNLTRDANSGGDIDEDVIDNRQTSRGAEYGGGYWD
ncbi:hypothetical protein [Tsukamurella pulmonis]|uniref:hypothetical protein n=1 Tax=Tsukamurella pulmonis TaxID=47312 RepID=UPI000E095A13|nr:hypothetical protein [Tsukamurella pulmonis]RDH13415.1 hypothetical protein DVB88_02550 [Tsukamurella pulmonis]